MAWRRLGKQEQDSKLNPAQDQDAFSRRLSSVLAASGVDDADPDEVETRIRNISHGAGRD